MLKYDGFCGLQLTICLLKVMKMQTFAKIIEEQKMDVCNEI